MIFVSTSVYALAKELGAENAVAEVHRQLAECTSAIKGPFREDTLPAVRVIARLRLLDELALHVDAGATCIGKARSRAFHAYRESKADLWVSVDDDNDATLQTLRWLVEAVSSSEPRVCLAPYLLRGPRNEPTLSVELPNFDVDRTLSNGGRVRNARRGGFGLVALNRAAVSDMVNGWAPLGSLDWRDDDGVTKLAVFHDQLQDGTWYGEDLSFFRRLPRTTTVEALASGHTSHDQLSLDLSTVADLQP